MRPPRALCAAGLLVLGLCAGCGSSRDELGVARPSIVQALPVPAQATLIVGKADGSAKYSLPAGVDIAELNAWYEHYLPAGAPWRGWGACRSVPLLNTTGPGTENWSWEKGGSRLVLSTSNRNGRTGVVMAEEQALNGPFSVAC